MDELRLAWEAHREGRATRRDALLTLAVAGAGRDRKRWARPLAGFLLKARPDHLFAGYQTLGQALGDPHVTASLRRLRVTFPPARLRRLVQRHDVARGPFTGRMPSIEAMVEEITSSLPRLRVQAVPARLAESTSTAPTFSGEGLGFPPDADPLLKFYLSTLLATATLLAIVLRDDQDMRAA